MQAPHELAAEPQRAYDAQAFGEAARAARSLSDLCRALGLVPRGANYATMRRRAADWGVDISHLEAAIRRRPTLTHAQLRTALAGARSRADVLRRLGQTTTSDSYAWLRRQARSLDVELDVPGQGWAAGTRRPRIPVEEYLVHGPSRLSSSKLRLRLIEDGVLLSRCAGCLLSEWQDQPIPLELDHVNGDRSDNRIQNLRLLCPNCHAFTPTYRGRNIGRGS